MNIETVIKLNRFQPRENFKGKNNPAYRHGMAGSPTYKIWVGILTRCYNPKSRIYKYYGGRGIKVCDRWRDFINFYSDMGERPNNLQIDRIDHNKDYCAENCRWVTAMENNPYTKGEIPDNMPGKRFGKWLVLEPAKHKKGHRYYLCKCDCGSLKIRCGGELRRGRTTQCIQCKNKAHGGIHKGWYERRNKLQ